MLEFQVEIDFVMCLFGTNFHIVVLYLKIAILRCLSVKIIPKSTKKQACYSVPCV